MCIRDSDLGAAGANYGWPITEGTTCLGGGTNCDTAGLTGPIWDYRHQSGLYAVIGGIVYRGCGLPDLQGLYFFSDAPYFGNSPLWSLDVDGASPVQGPIWQATAQPLTVSFGEDEEGELYVADPQGSQILKLVAP